MGDEWGRPSRVFDRLLEPMRIGPTVVRARRRRARFPEEYDYEIHVESHGCRGTFHVRVFDGRPPHYRPWVEVYGVPGPECMPRELEGYIIALAAHALGPGGKLYFEYGWDPETLEELSRGVPPHVSRLGLAMAVHGFTWLRDWYHPEGFWEGGQKLAGEKPVSPDRAREHLEEAIREARHYVERGGVYSGRVGARIRVLELLLAGGAPGAVESGRGPGSPRRES